MNMTKKTLFILIFLQLLKNGMTLTWQLNPITAVSKVLQCGLESLVEEWQTQLTVTFTSTDLTNIDKEVSFQTAKGTMICNVYIDKCLTTIPSTKGCFCSSAGMDYTIKMRQTGQYGISEQEIIAVVFPSDGSAPTEEHIRSLGTLPFVYRKDSSTCKVNGYPAAFDKKHNVAQHGVELNITCCVQNLLEPYEVKVTTDNNASLVTNKPCVTSPTIFHFQRPTWAAHEVALEFRETNSAKCGRSNKRVFSIDMHQCFKENATKNNPCKGHVCLPAFTNLTCDCTRFANGSYGTNISQWASGATCEETHACAAGHKKTCGSGGVCSRNCTHPDEHVCLMWAEDEGENQDQKPSKSSSKHTVSVLAWMFLVANPILISM